MTIPFLFPYSYSMFFSYQYCYTSWSEQRISPSEWIYIRNLVQKHIFKILNDFNTSVLNSKNLNNAKKLLWNYWNSFPTRTIKVTLNYLYKCSSGESRTATTSKMEISVTIVNSGTPLNYCHKKNHLRHSRSAFLCRTQSRTLTFQKILCYLLD